MKIFEDRSAQSARRQTRIVPEQNFKVVFRKEILPPGARSRETFSEMALTQIDKETTSMFTREAQNPLRHRSRFLVGLALATLATLIIGRPDTARADEVIDWNQTLFVAARAANLSPLITGRSAAIMHAAMFDAINGIEPRYRPYRVFVAGPRRASQRAAAVKAAYATLVELYPAQKEILDAQRAASLAAITDERPRLIERGIEWGQMVADDILTWRSTDGFTPAPPPFLGGLGVGEWRPTPPRFASGHLPQFAYMTPFALLSPGQFRPAGPPSLVSAQYVEDFNEVKDLGRATDSSRTAEQTEVARFWAGAIAYYWNQAARSVATERGTSLAQNARLFALLNIALADANIASWEAKYTYVFWRPITAITLADTDDNPATEPDAAWTPLLNTPAHPEYPAGHPTDSGAAATVLATYFGSNDAMFTLDSEVLPGVLRSYTSFTQAADENNDSRVYAGAHFRSAVCDGGALGQQIGDYIMTNLMRPCPRRCRDLSPSTHVLLRGAHHFAAAGGA